MDPRSAALQHDLQVEADAYRQLQADIQQNHRLRQQSLQQQHENEMVLQEINLLADRANVYKMIGPVLVRQDTGEARSNVNKRLEFIAGEVKRLDVQLQQLEEKQSKKQGQVIKIQQELQKMQQQQAAAAAAAQQSVAAS